MTVVVSDLLPGLFDGVVAGLEDAPDIVIAVFHVFVDPCRNTAAASPFCESGRA